MTISVSKFFSWILEIDSMEERTPFCCTVPERSSRVSWPKNKGQMVNDSTTFKLRKSQKDQRLMVQTFCPYLFEVIFVPWTSLQWTEVKVEILGHLHSWVLIFTWLFPPPPFFSFGEDRKRLYQSSLRWESKSERWCETRDQEGVRGW